MKYIETFREGDKINDIYLCKFKQSATTKNGKDYENVTFQDKTGTVGAKIWEPNSSGINEFGVMDYVFVSGDVTSYQGSLQLNVRRARKAQENEYVVSDYLPVSEKNIDDMYEELMTLMRQVENPYLQKLIRMYYVDNSSFIDAFKKHSAAKTAHHSFAGGLLEHTLGVVKLCVFYTQQYPYLNKDLLLTAALFHDIGKLKEISNFPENDYTDDGQLLGHIVMGSELVGFGCRHIKDFPRKLMSELQHCILAHHGELEFGSPKKPALAEAMALNYADNTDAKLETMREVLKGAGDNPDWLGYNRLFETNLRKSSEF